MLFTKSAAVKVNGWSSLRPYSVGYMKGMDVAENPIQILDKLNAGRTDLAILPRLVGYRFQAQYPEIKMLEPPLEKIALYAYLSAKRAALAPALANALTELQESGRLKAVTLHQVLSDLKKRQ